MKLNADCIRDILLSVEEISNVGICVAYISDSKTPLPPQAKLLALKGEYTLGEIEYHLRQCELSGFFYKVERFGALSLITDLSPKGHEFLENIRKDTVWNKTKSIGNKIGATSLSAFVQIASNVISEIIKSEMLLPP